MKCMSYVICTAILIVSCLFVPVIAEVPVIAGYSGGSSSGNMVFTSQSSQVAIAIPAPGSSGDVSIGNFSRLYVSPQNLQFRLGPGESDEQTFSVTNKGKEVVMIRPKVTEMPYSGPNMMDTTWLSISPAEMQIGPGEKAKFTVNVMVPSDTVRGYYSAQLALTDEQFPSPGSASYPTYVYQLTISTEVYTPPVLSVSPYMLSDSLEAGKSYDYAVILKNSGDHPIRINPDLESRMYYTPMSSGGSENGILPKESITILGQGEIPAGGETPLAVHINVPADTGGYYNGVINLGIDDPAVQEGEGMIQLNFMVWKQPAEPFSRPFTMTDDGPLTIELVATKDTYGGTASAVNGGKSAVEPSFDLSIDSPDGKVIPNLTKKVIKGSVDFTGQEAYTVGSKEAPYRETGIQYVSTYTLSGKAGPWNLRIMPHNMGRFDYIITMGPLGDLTIKPSLTSTVVTTSVPVRNLTPVAISPGFPNLNQTNRSLDQNQTNST
jgi:hypothetical protein